MSSKPKRPSRPRKSSSYSRASLALTKTQVVINCYDLLPPGKLSTLLWTLGSSLLHSGVVINNREYAYGGHDTPSTTGVYYTRPRFEPSGATFRCHVLQGFTFNTEAEIEAVIRDVSEQFLGTGYNLLHHNCNHFTSVLCERLTGRPAPAWLNRAARVGVNVPCVVPAAWIGAPDCETAEGELVDEGESGDEGEEVGMLAAERRRERREALQRVGGAGVRDTSGREVPVAERAPVPKRRGSGSG
ncbi:hypothetical protein MBLNU230_g1215t1 [Neophaeotheca triangularis]